MYGYGYRYSIRPGYVPFNPLTDINGLQLYLNKNTNVNSKLALSLNGSTDAVNIDSVLTPLASTTTGEIELYYTPVTGVSIEVIFSYGDTDADSYIYIANVNGILYARVYNSGTITSQSITDSVVFSNGVQEKINIIHNGTDLTIKIDDIEVSQTNSGTNQTEWISAISGLDNGRIGCLNTNSGGNTTFSDSTIQDVKIWSDDTQTTLVASYLFNDANSPYKDYANSYDGSAIGTPTSVVGSQQESTEPLDEVFSWVDQSTNGFIFSQNTVTKQPQLASDGNSIDFDGTDDSLDNSTANVFSGDSSGIIFFSGYLDNSTNNTILGSSDNLTIDYTYNLRILSTGYLSLFTKDSGVSKNKSCTTTQISNGAFYYGYVKSTGTAYEFNLNGVTQSFTGTDDGEWFADITLRDNLVLGSGQTSPASYGHAKINKVIYSNDYTIDTTPILNFLSNPDN